MKGTAMNRGVRAKRIDDAKKEVATHIGISVELLNIVIFTNGYDLSWERLGNGAAFSYPRDMEITKTVMKNLEFVVKHINSTGWYAAPIDADGHLIIIAFSTIEDAEKWATEPAINGEDISNARYYDVYQ